MLTVKQEVFPEFSLDRITISIPYLGAAPAAEVEEAVNVRVEEAIQGIDGIKQIISTALGGYGLSDHRARIGSGRAQGGRRRQGQRRCDRHVPRRDGEADRSRADLPAFGNRHRHLGSDGRGDAEKTLAEQVRDDLSAHPEITQVEMINARPYEISIEVSETALRRHGLSFDEVARAIRRSSLDLPGGSVRTEGGEILLRTIGQA